jgi:hypothetical protein
MQKKERRRRSTATAFSRHSTEAQCSMPKKNNEA